MTTPSGHQRSHRAIVQSMFFPIHFEYLFFGFHIVAASAVPFFFEKNKHLLILYMFLTPLLGPCWATQKNTKNFKTSAALHGSDPAKCRTSATLHGKARADRTVQIGPKQKRSTQNLPSRYFKTFIRICWIPLTGGGPRSCREIISTPYDFQQVCSKS